MKANARRISEAVQYRSLDRQFPMSVLSVLIATSKSYEVHEVLQWLVPLLLLNLGLIVLGVYLISRAIVRIHRYDRLLDVLKRKNPRLAELLD